LNGYSCVRKLDGFVRRKPNNPPLLHKRSQDRFARRLICPTGKSVVAYEILSIPSRENISLVPSGKSPPLVSAVPSSPRGALRDRHERWERDAVDAEVSLTSDTNADGEVVWS
jgi:hypothetical protein